MDRGNIVKVHTKLVVMPNVELAYDKEADTIYCPPELEVMAKGWLANPEGWQALLEFNKRCPLNSETESDGTLEVKCSNG